MRFNCNSPTLKTVFFMSAFVPKTKLNIWSISHYACPPIYGYGTGHHFLAEEHVKNGHRVTIFASSYNHYMNIERLPPRNLPFEIIDGVNYVWLKSFKYYNSHSFRRVVNWFYFVLNFFLKDKGNFGKPDVVIMSSHSMLPILCAMWTKYKFNSKIIFEIRDVWPETFVEIGGKSKFHPLIFALSFFERLSYRSADHIVSTLPNIVKRVKEVSPRMVNCVTIIPQGLPESLFNTGSKLDAEFIKKYFVADEFRVMYTGAIGPSNALDNLIESAKIIRAKFPTLNLRFFILGDGIDKTRLISLAEDSENIVFVPRIDRFLVQDFLSYGHLFYDSVRSSSLYEYGLSRQKWMDYMYAGKPLLASYSGYKSLINDANCGEFVFPNDVNALVDRILYFQGLSMQELLEIGKRGREYLLQNRTFPALAFKYELVFRDLLSKDY